LSFSLGGNKRKERRDGGAGKERKEGKEERMTRAPTCMWSFCKINPPLVRY